jgi:hypothetical protein
MRRTGGGGVYRCRSAEMSGAAARLTAGFATGAAATVLADPAPAAASSALVALFMMPNDAAALT